MKEARLNTWTQWIQEVHSLLASFEKTLPPLPERNEEILPHVERAYRELHVIGKMSKEDLEEILRYFRGEVRKVLCLLPFLRKAFYILSRCEEGGHITPSLEKVDSLLKIV